MRWVLLGSLFLTAAPAVAQNNGLPSRQQSVVLLELITTRGLACELLRPWQAQALRIQTRSEAERLDADARAAVAAEVEERLPRMGCDDPLLVTWIESAGPNLEREFLPELLSAYLALAQMEAPPAAIDPPTAEIGLDEAIVRIQARISEFETTDMYVPGGTSWPELHARQREHAAQISAAISRDETVGRYSVEEASRMMVDLMSVVGLWLMEEGPRER